MNPEPQDTRDRAYCRQHCKGFRDTGGLCFADGECEDYTKNNKDMNIRPRREQREASAYLCRAEKDVYGVNEVNDMNPARQAFEDGLHEVILEAITCSAAPLHQVITNAADRLIELARRVINEE